MVVFLCMTDRLKFLKEIEARVIGTPSDRTRRSLDALDEMRSENSRLKRELDQALDENRRLREQLAQNRTIPAVPATILPSSPVIKEPVQEDEDPTSIRFSLLELQ